MYFRIELVKKPENKNFNRRNKNIRDSNYHLNITEWFEGPSKLLNAKRKTRKKFIEKKLQQINDSRINYDFEYSKKEKVRLMKEKEYNNYVYEGYVKFPKHLRKEDVKKSDMEKQSKFGDMK